MNLERWIKRQTEKKKENKLTSTQLIAFGFLAVILLGTVLLMLPCMNRSGQWTPFVDALFMATTSVCVTGLSLVNVYQYWTLPGQMVILLLIQIGGIGVVALATLFFMIMGKKLP